MSDEGNVHFSSSVRKRAPWIGYDRLIFDCDGVIVDSNVVKEENIRKAALAVCESAIAERFVRYFVSNNGLPRETKIAAYFEDVSIGTAILAMYNQLNASTVPFVGPTPGAVAFLRQCAAAEVPLYLLSGGDDSEVRQLIENIGITFLFIDLLCAPQSKIDHLHCLNLEGRTCYFGDSRYDYEVSRQFGFDFVFMSRYTQFSDWREFFSDKPEVEVTSDFLTFTN